MHGHLYVHLSFFLDTFYLVWCFDVKNNVWYLHTCAGSRNNVLESCAPALLIIIGIYADLFCGLINKGVMKTIA